MGTMKAKFTKITAFLLTILVIFGVFTGCARETDEALLAEAQTLLDKSAPLNALLFGSGFLPKEGGYSSGAYTEADESSLAAYGISTVAALRERMAEVYSAFTCDYVESIVLAPVRDGGSVVSYRRYYDGVDKDRPVLMVYRDFDPIAADKVSYGNLRMVSHGRSRAEILTDITVYAENETTVQKDVSLLLRYEDGWRLDTVSYAAAQKSQK